MNISKFFELLKTLGIPVAYHHFNTEQKPPYMIYLMDTEPDFMADNSHYATIKSGLIEIYTEKKDVELEYALRNALSQNPRIAYAKNSEDFIDSEGVFLVRYYFEFLGDD